MQNLNQTMPLEQAFNLIDQALRQLNANRETHALLVTAQERIQNEIANLNQQLQEARNADSFPSLSPHAYVHEK